MVTCHLFEAPELSISFLNEPTPSVAGLPIPLKSAKTQDATRGPFRTVCVIGALGDTVLGAAKLLAVIDYTIFKDKKGIYQASISSGAWQLQLRYGAQIVALGTHELPLDPKKGMWVAQKAKPNGPAQLMVRCGNFLDHATLASVLRDRIMASMPYPQQQQLADSIGTALTFLPDRASWIPLLAGRAWQAFFDDGRPLGHHWAYKGEPTPVDGPKGLELAINPRVEDLPSAATFAERVFSHFYHVIGARVTGEKDCPTLCLTWR